MSNNSEHRSGFVAVVGRPNVGKSTLVNALVGQKISIVTSKPHTTRHAIMGILTEPDAQVVFIDTPGMDTRQRNLMNRAMNRAATGTLDFANVILLVVSAEGWTPGDDHALELARAVDAPCVLVVNKVDTVKPRDRLLPVLQDFAGRHDFAEIVPLSALRMDNLEALGQVLRNLLPQQEPLYPAEMLTDRGLRFRAAEVLREKLMDMLRQELPYGLGVEINELGEDEEGLLRIDAIVWVDRESHKGIVVGKGGALIKRVGTAARLDLQKQLDRSVHLETRVKVKRNWTDNAQALRDMGFEGEA